LSASYQKSGCREFEGAGVLENSLMIKSAKMRQRLSILVNLAALLAFLLFLSEVSRSGSSRPRRGGATVVSSTANGRIGLHPARNNSHSYALDMV
jgi:hypothetical protein